MDNPIVSRQEWLKARIKFLEKEKAFTKARDALTEERRQLPFVKIENEYIFQSGNGKKSLGDLFGNSTQLVVYHFMYGPDWQEGCVSCSFWADNFNYIAPHLEARDTSFVAISNASMEQIDTYRKRLNWSFPWVSSNGTGFNADFGVSSCDDGQTTEGPGYNYSGKSFQDEMPGISVFIRLEDGTICHSYSTYSRGLDMMNGAYHFLDLTPLGRNESDLDYSMSWLKRRDSYPSQA
ncbi:MAG: DUF899 domain-containing protein [Cohaesibacteraceae bacterium]|nr:DUF899 domain-containing protein [Cohaesibacteraceae bacterium]